MGKLSPLRRRMIEDMTVRNLSPATEAAYMPAVEKLGRLFGRSPEPGKRAGFPGTPGFIGQRRTASGSETEPPT